MEDVVLNSIAHHHQLQKISREEKISSNYYPSRTKEVQLPLLAHCAKNFKCGAYFFVRVAHYV